MNSDPKLEDLIGQMGNFGRYQLRQYLLHCVTCFLAGLNMLAFTFVSKTPKLYRCFIEEIDGDLLGKEPTFNQSILSKYIPYHLGEFDSCQKFSISGNLSSNLSSCEGQFVYDKSTFHQSRVYEWNMVCDDERKKALAQSIYFFGVGVGALICGGLSDRFGRKKVLCITALLQFSFALMSAFIQNYLALCIVFFVYGGVASAGPIIPGFILALELISKKTRFLAITFGSFFSLGITAVGIWAYFIRNITTLQIVFACHSILLFGHWFFMDESIRWLWGKGRIYTAIEIVKKACKTNRLPFKDKDLYYQKSEVETEIYKKKESYGLLDLFRTPVIRLRIFLISFTFFSASLSYYGFQLNTGSLPGNQYLIFTLTGLMDLIGDVILVLIVNHVGRKVLNFTFLILSAGAYFAMAWPPAGGPTIIIISFIGKIACASVFRIVFIYAGEIFPTVVRNSSTGFGSMMARVGGVLAPQVLLLANFNKKLPPLITGSVAIFAGILSLFLPETLNKNLPQTIDDGENFGK